MTTLAIVLGLSYVVATTIQAWYFIRELRRQREECRDERGELTDRIMALSSKPESLVAVQAKREEEEPAEPIYVGEDTPWHEVKE